MNVLVFFALYFMALLVCLSMVILMHLLQDIVSLARLGRE